MFTFEVGLTHLYDRQVDTIIALYNSDDGRQVCFLYRYVN